MKKLLAFILALSLVLSFSVVLVSAEENEPEGYFWLKGDGENDPGINFKVPGDVLVDDNITIEALVMFGEDCVANGGCVYLNCYSYEKDEYNNWDYLISFIDYAKESSFTLGEWSKATFTFNPFDGAYGTHAGSKYTPEMLSMGIGFYLATGTISVAYISVSQNGEEVWSIDFTAGFDPTRNSDLEKVCEGGIFNIDEGTRDIKWGTVGTAAVIDEPLDEPGQLYDIARYRDYTIEGSTERGDGWDDDGSKLTDGILAYDASTDFVGLQGPLDGDISEVSVIVDLGSVYSFSEIQADATYGDWGIYAPSGVRFSISGDGEEFGDDVDVPFEQASSIVGYTGNWTGALFVAEGDFEGRYVKVTYYKENDNQSNHIWVSEIIVLSESEPMYEPEPGPEPEPEPDPDPVDITAGVTATASVVRNGGYAYFRFVPEETALYTFYSSAHMDTVGYIYDKDMNQLYYDDDSNGDRNFLIYARLAAGETYFLGAKYYGWYETGSFDVMICKFIEPEDEIVSVLGDINGSGTVTSDDAVYLLRYTLFPDTYPAAVYTDFNCDGRITSDDAVYLLRNTLFPQTYPLEPKYAEGLEYMVNNNGWTCTVTGIGSFEGSVLNIPPRIDGLKVTSVGSSAFAENQELTNVVFPDGLQNIGWNAFSGCSNLKAVIVAGRPSYISSGAFSGVAGLHLIIPEGTRMIYGGKYYYNNPDALYIDWMESLTGITFPGTLEIIGEESFYNCNNLASVSIPESVTKIGNAAFSHCSALKSINLPESLTEIGSSAFAECVSLKSVYIPAGVITVGSGAFSGCVSLNRITVAPGNTVFCAQSNCLIDKESKNLVAGCKNSVIPSDGSVESIGEGAFSGCTGLTEIVIPDSVVSISWNAFSGCTGLTAVTLGKNITSIYGNAFMGCTSLATVNIPEGVTSIGYNAFRNCSVLTDVNIPESVTEIGGGAFAGCSGLTSINVPAGVKEIGDYAFNLCTGLTEITISDTVEKIGYRAFAYCTGLTSVKLPDSGLVVDAEAFYGCSRLMYVSIPDSIKNIGYDAFRGCGELAYYEYNNGLYLGNGANHYVYLAETLDNTVTSFAINAETRLIGGAAFNSFTGLKKITIPENVTGIGNGAFDGCVNLVLVINNSGLNIVPGDYGNGCVAYYAYKVINKDESVQYRNDGYEYVEDENGFIFDYDGSIYRLRAYAGNNISVTLPENVNGSAYDLYMVRGVRKVTIPEGAAFIADDAFNGCTTLTSVTVPAGVTRIGWSAFYGCSSLESVSLPEGIEVIENNAFGYCSALNELAIPSTVTDIGGNAFYGCSNLQSVIVPDGVRQINSNTFRYCGSLSQISLPADLTYIGYYAFYDCANLDSIEFRGTNEKWDGVEKEYGWDNYTGNYTVTCTDGTVSKYTEPQEGNGGGWDWPAMTGDLGIVALVIVSALSLGGIALIKKRKNG